MCLLVCLRICIKQLVHECPLHTQNDILSGLLPGVVCTRQQQMAIHGGSYYVVDYTNCLSILYVAILVWSGKQPVILLISHQSSTSSSSQPYCSRIQSRTLYAAGLACSCSAWRWQLQDLMTHHLQAVAHGDGKLASLQSPFQVCIIDNRGVGNSSSPAKKREYSTASMAQDVLQVMVSTLLGEHFAVNE